MLLLEKEIHLTDKDTQTNIKLPFEMEEIFDKLRITFSYGPETSRDEAARAQVKEAIEKYVFDGAPEEDYLIESFLPVENFITLSLSKDGQYLGGHHNKAKKQTVVISLEEASLGFWPARIEPAEWELQLNCHCIASKEVDVKVKIQGVEK